MSVDLTKLAGQGRAYNGARAWTPEELDALLALEHERGIGRLKAADYVRNGIVTLDAYDAAVTAEYVPKTLEVAAAQTEATLRDNPFAVPEDTDVPVSEPNAPESEVSVPTEPIVETPVEEAAPTEEVVPTPEAEIPVEEAAPVEAHVTTGGRNNK